MFESLSAKLQDVFDGLSRKGRLDESDVEQGLRAIRLALLEADVNYRVVKEFTAKVKERAVGTEVLQSLTPGQQIVKIVHENLIELLGAAAPLEFSGRAPHAVALVGLQGVGKTTMSAKLAVSLRRRGHSPLLVAADIQRPAAIDQLEALGAQVDVPVYADRSGSKAPAIAERAMERARAKAHTVVLIDTAGRSQIDDALMAELDAIRHQVQLTETLLVVDAMTGQEAVNVANGFHESLPLTGLIMTKIDGDARGGAALSIRQVTGVPIKFLGTSEKMDGLETFHPEGMANRILGMGDVLALIEKAETLVDEEEAERLANKLMHDRLDLEDFLGQMRSMRKMGGILDMIKLVPGAQQLVQDVDEEEVNQNIRQFEAIISSMTPQERRNPRILNGSRRRRIAAGSGTQVSDVNGLMKQFNEAQKMMGQMGLGGKSGGRRRRPKASPSNPFSQLGRF